MDEELKVHLITYNVGTWAPHHDLDMTTLLPQKTVPDVVLLGFQEVNTSPTALVLENVLSALGEDEWTSRSRINLAKKGYIKIRSIKLLGMVLSLFCLEKHVPYLRGVETQFTRLGLNGYWGNKGTVSVRFNLYGVSLCVLNSHLAAHDHQNQIRIESYDTVLGGHTYTNEATEAIMYHDYVFWLGDLNFRLQEDTFTFEEIDQKVRKKELKDLLTVDQLSQARADGQAFSELDETIPDFPPTFKYKFGTDVYDSKRRPAWTDRILFKVNTANYDKIELKLKQDSYRSHPEVRNSDHKPVSSSFRVGIFTPEMAAQMGIQTYHPIVKFHVDEVYVDEDNTMVYTVDTKNMRYLRYWDWIGVYRVDTHSFESHLAFQWAPNTPARDNAYELFFDENVFIRRGDYRLVYYSADSKDILGVSPPFHARVRDLEPEMGVEVTEEL